MDLLEKIMPSLLQGMKVTIIVSIIGLILSLSLGFIFALLLRTRNKIIEGVLNWYIRLFRNTPFMIQVYLAYNLPPLLGLHPKAIVLGTIILVLYEAAYMTVTIKMGFDSISKGQEEAAISLNIPYPTRVIRILLPQVMKVVMPTITSLLIVTVKDSSILSVITIKELTMQATGCASSTFMPFEVYIIAGLLYWVLNICIELATKLINRKYLSF